MKIILAVMAAVIGLMCYQIHNLQAESGRQLDIYIVDWDSIVKHDWGGPENTNLAIAATNSSIEKLKARGALVLDNAAAISVPDGHSIGVPQVSYLVQQAMNQPNQQVPTMPEGK